MCGLVAHKCQLSICVCVSVERVRRAPSKSRKVIKTSNFVWPSHANTLFSGNSQLFVCLLNDVAAAAARIF